MAAVATTTYYTGAPTGTPGSDVIGLVVRFKRADNHVQDVATPVPYPNSGESLSWRKSCKMNWTSSPTAAITNLRFFCAAPTSGIKHYARVQSTYVQASAADEAGIASFTATQGNKDAHDETNHTSASPLVVNAGTVLSNPATGEGTQDFVEQQLGVKSTYAGGAGPVASFALTYRYEES